MKKSQISVFEALFGIFLVFSIIFIFSSLSNFSVQESFTVQESIDSFLLTLTRDDEFREFISELNLSQDIVLPSNSDWNQWDIFIRSQFPSYSLTVSNMTDQIILSQCVILSEYLISEKLISFFNTSNGETILNIVQMGVCI